ncbi:MAG: hypothetical protein GC190_21790 [Alphaproteobacteria bacterium]|nr:hypothetical protein [Alphaproteobacteria bacterium]
MSEPFDAADWYASMRDAGQDVMAVDFVERAVQLVVVGRSYDNARDAQRWAALVDHRDAIIEFLNARDRRGEAA